MQYVNTLEQERLENLAGELQQAYVEEGGWEFLRRDPVAWLRLMVRTLPPELVDPARLQRLERRLERRAERRAERGERIPPREPPPGLAQKFELRVLLLDADHRQVFGPPPSPGLALRPLQVNGQTVGYLGLLPRRGLIDVHQLRFVRQQKLALVLIAAVMLLVSALIALPLAQAPAAALAGAGRGHPPADGR